MSNCACGLCWADGHLDQEGGGPPSAHRSGEGLDIEEIAEIEEATKQTGRPTASSIRTNRSREGSLVRVWVESWITAWTEWSPRPSKLRCNKLGEALKVTEKPRIIEDGIAQETSRTFGRPAARYDLVCASPRHRERWPSRSQRRDLEPIPKNAPVTRSGCRERPAPETGLGANPKPSPSIDFSSLRTLRCCYSPYCVCLVDAPGSDSASSARVRGSRALSSSEHSIARIADRKQALYSCGADGAGMHWRKSAIVSSSGQKAVS